MSGGVSLVPEVGVNLGTEVLPVQVSATPPTTGQVLTATSATAANWQTPATGFTEEAAQDAVGTILVDSSTIDLTYTDATPSITASVIDDSVTFAKIQNITESKLLGRGQGSGAGDTQELTVGSGLSLSGTTLSASSSLEGFTGASNTGYGDNAGDSITSATGVVAVGVNAGTAITSSTGNTAIGFNALSSAATVDNNTAVGYQALAALNASTGGNTAVGSSALAATTSGNGNTAVGSGALDVNTTGSSNVGIGSNALGQNEGGGSNVAIGNGTLGSNVSGDACVAVGASALAGNTASDNVAVGANALDTNTSGTRNVAMGRSALTDNTSASDSTGIGHRALVNSTGTQNTALGSNAGDLVTSGTANTFIGYNADSDSATGVGRTVIGKDAVGIVNNCVQLGKAADSVAVGAGAIATTATDGFLYVPTCAGPPTGTPTTITGLAPIVIDGTNNKLYFYSGGSWRDAGP